MQALAREAPGLRCELVEAEPEESLPALALGDVDLVLADEWQHQPLRAAGRRRRARTCTSTRCTSSCPRTTRRRGASGDAVPLAELADEAWTTGHRGDGLGGDTERTCRELGGFDPDIRHRTNDSVTSLALVAGGRAVTLLPALVADPGARRGVACRRSPRAQCTGRSSWRPERRRRAALRPGAAGGRAGRRDTSGLVVARRSGAELFQPPFEEAALGVRAHPSSSARS